MADLSGKRILVTGGAGFIGSHIVDLLCNEGCAEIVAVDNMVRGRPENLGQSLKRGPVHIVQGDIRDTKLIATLVKNADIVFHQAALRITHCAAEPRVAMEVMVQATFDLLELCVHHKIEKVIAASSASVYGMAEEFPTTEKQSPYDNRTLYGAAKAFNEGLLRTFNDMYGLDYVAFRYFNVYGDRMDIHGRYTEVLIRWMERLEAGLPPVFYNWPHRSLPSWGTAGLRRNSHPSAPSIRYRAAWHQRKKPNDGLASGRPFHLRRDCANSSIGGAMSDVHRQPCISRKRSPHDSDRAAIVGEEADAARDAIVSGWISQGPQVAAFEREFAGYASASFATAVSNCTTALHLALLAANIGPGDEVITSSHSFIATANCIKYCGGIPVFVDIDPETYNIDPDRVVEAITPRTRAILAVHQMGMPCDLNILTAIARRHDIILIEDAACAAGSEIRVDGRWDRIGKPHGHVSCFSFHPRKVITTGEGGMLTTSSLEYDRKFKLLRQHGMSVPDTVRHSAAQVIFESYLEVGFNYRMTDLQAAIGRKQLEKIDDIVVRRRALAARYSELLGNIGPLRLPAEPKWARSNWQSYCVGLPDHVDQRHVMQSLLDQGIATRRGIMCSHREPPYANGERQRHTLRQSELAQDRSILLPIYAQMTEADQDRVVDSLKAELAR